MRRATSIVPMLLIPACVITACGQVPVAPDAASPAPTSPTVPTFPPPVGVYAATLRASASCSAALPEAARERTYTASVFADGKITWAGSSLKPPSGHLTISSGSTQADGTFTFSIDVERDPQSDGFNGLWDDFSNGSYLNISGKGAGTVEGAEITGKLNGLFAFYGPVVPPAPNISITGHYCLAADHQFRLLKQ